MTTPKFYVGQQVIAIVGEESAMYTIVSGSTTGDEWSYYIKQDDGVTVSVLESDISHRLNDDHKWHSISNSSSQRIAM